MEKNVNTFCKPFRMSHLTIHLLVSYWWIIKVRDVNFFSRNHTRDNNLVPAAFQLYDRKLDIRENTVVRREITMTDTDIGC